MNLLKAATGSKVLRVGAIVGLTAASLLAVAQQGQAATAVVLTAAPVTGPVTAGSVVTLTAAANTFQAGSVVNVDNISGAVDIAGGAVQFNAAATCPAGEATASTTAGAEVYNVAAASIVNGGKLVIKAATMVGSLAGKAYKVCVYDKTATPVLLAAGGYKVYAAPTVASLSPSAGPVYGGTTVTVTGNNFTASVASAGAVTIGGSALTGVKLVSPTVLTGVVPAHAKGAAAVVVTTEGGASAGATQFTYADGISVSPKTMTTNSTAVLEITGQGFTALNALRSGFPATASDTDRPHIYVVDGLAYDDTGTTKAHGQKGECLNAMVVSDTQLVCTLSSASLAAGAYQVVIVNDGTPGHATAATAFTQTIVSSESTFTVAAY